MQTVDRARQHHQEEIARDIVEVSKSKPYFVQALKVRKSGHYSTFKRGICKLEKLAKNSRMRVVSTEGIFLKPIKTEQIITLGLTDKILNAFLKVGINYPELCVAILMELQHEK